MCIKVSNAIICGPGLHHKPKACSVCGELAEKLCDFPMRTDPEVTRRKRGTCDAAICDTHAHEVSPDRHVCPRHQAVWTGKPVPVLYKRPGMFGLMPAADEDNRTRLADRVDDLMSDLKVSQ